MALSTTINPVTASDIPAVVDLIYHQKLSMPLNRLMWKQWPDEAAQKARIKQAVEGSLHNSSAKFLKISNNDAAGVLGILVLTPRRSTTANEEPEKPSQEDAKPSLPPPDLDHEVLDTIIAATNALDQGMTQTDHWEVTVFVVDQSLRRKGVGTQLIQAAFEAAREEQIPLVVRSEPASTDFFRKHKFQEVDHQDVDLARFAPPFSGLGPFRLTQMTWSA